MSTNSFDSFETYIQNAEQDQHGDGDLPSYDDLAAQHSPNPNSRFGRWRGWIEKRAAERYADISPADMVRRRARGWGESPDCSTDIRADEPNTSSTPSGSYSDQSRAAHVPPLRIFIDRDLPDLPAPSSQANEGMSHTEPTSTTDTSSQSLQDLQGAACETLPPTHLQLHHFGSRFLPHTTSPIRCILPINRDRLLLIGTDNGLSVLDMYPMEWASDGNVGIVQNGPGDAQARIVWTGEAVYQMSILEHEDIGEGTPQGVVLALVGPDPGAPSASNGHQETLRTLRIYNLASLTNLAKWTIAQKGAHPVDLRRASDWNIQQTPVKKHRQTNSITRGLKSLIESPSRSQQPATSYEAYLTVPKRNNATPTTAPADASWDLIDDLPLRWATDYVPLASPCSRLASSSVISYALWHEGGPGPDGGRHGRRALLAVATKPHIFLYETPKGERAFHFVTDFYNPIQPRHLAFVHQSVDTRSLSDGGASQRQTGYGHSRGSSSDSHSSTHPNRTPSSRLTYSAQMALFVMFEKKAVIIRIADAAVTEVEMYDPGSNSSGISSVGTSRDSLSVSSPTGSRRSRTSLEFMAFKEVKGPWIPPTLIDLPAAQLPDGDMSCEKSVYMLTRGRITHIIPAPLPAVIQHVPPIHVLAWSSTPSSVSIRICIPMTSRTNPRPETPPFLQFIAFNEDGVEVQEILLAVLVCTNSKGKGRSDGNGNGNRNSGGVVLADPCRGQSFIGETGFLAQGGHWHRLPSEITAPLLERSNSSSSFCSFESAHTDVVVARLKAEAGVYGWLRKSVEDWRVFWVGGDAREMGGRSDEADGVLV